MNLFKNFTQEDKDFLFELEEFIYEEDEDDGSIIDPESVVFKLPSGQEIEMSDEGDLEHGYSYYTSPTWSDEENEKINDYLGHEECSGFTMNKVIDFAIKQN